MHKLPRTRNFSAVSMKSVLNGTCCGSLGLILTLRRGCIEYIPGEKIKPRLQSLIVRFNRSFDLAAMEEFWTFSASVILLCLLFRTRLRQWQNYASPTLVKMAERVSGSWAALCVFVLVWRALGLGIFAKVRDQPDGNVSIILFEITREGRGKGLQFAQREFWCPNSSSLFTPYSIIVFWVILAGSWLYPIVSHTPAYDASDLQTFHPNCVRLLQWYKDILPDSLVWETIR